jgi:hypothetical protein
MDDDHVDPGELGHVGDPPDRDFADVTHQLDLQLPDLLAPVARAQCVGCKVRALRVERVEDRRRVARERRLVHRYRRIEERRVPFELGELEAGLSGVDHRFQQARDDILRVHEAHLVHLEKARVAGDVGDQEQGGGRGHGVIL